MPNSDSVVRRRRLKNDLAAYEIQLNNISLLRSAFNPAQHNRHYLERKVSTVESLVKSFTTKSDELRDDVYDEDEELSQLRGRLCQFIDLTDLTLSMLHRLIDQNPGCTEQLTPLPPMPPPTTPDSAANKKQTIALAATTEHAGPSDDGCPLCETAHNLHKCSEFHKLSPEVRLTQVNRFNRCTNCLSPRHNASKCRSGACRHCEQKHHTLLHTGELKPLQKTEPQAEPPSTPAAVTSPIPSLNDNSRRILKKTVLLCNQLKPHKKLPPLQDTVFGWIVGGLLASNAPRTVSLSAPPFSSHSNLQSEFWENEIGDGLKPTAPDKKLVTAQFIDTVNRQPDDRGAVIHPVITNSPQLSDLRPTAIGRLHASERRFAWDPAIKEAYSNCIDKYRRLERLKPLQRGTIAGGKQHFWPNHVIVGADRSTIKLREVSDGSAASSIGLSLNDRHRVGSTVSRNLLDNGLRFWTHRRAFTVSSEKMFHQNPMSEYQRRPRRLWEWTTDWDDPVHRTKPINWATFPKKLKSSKIKFDRCLVLAGECNSIPLISFCGYTVAHEACIRFRGVLASGAVSTNPMCSESNFAPLATPTTSRLELCGARLPSLPVAQIKRAIQTNFDHTIEPLPAIEIVAGQMFFVQRMLFSAEDKVVSDGHAVVNSPWVGGRSLHAATSFSFTHHLLLPVGQPITTTPVRHLFQKNGCFGRLTLVTIIKNQAFWPFGANGSVRTVPCDCVTCFKARPNATSPPMGDPSPSRITQCRHFQHAYIDIGKSMTLKNIRHASTHPRATKAMHQKMTFSATTAATQRLVSRHGPHHDMYIDTYTCCVGATPELKAIRVTNKTAKQTAVAYTAHPTQSSYHQPYRGRRICRNRSAANTIVSGQNRRSSYRRERNRA
jgi:Pao retrotransposon peptidase